MAYYENLPIYRRTMELAVFVESIYRHLGLSYVVIAEQGYSTAGLKRRVVTEKLIFVEG